VFSLSNTMGAFTLNTWFDKAVPPTRHSVILWEGMTIPILIKVLVWCHRGLVDLG
jgi:hypothetical protein